MSANVHCASISIRFANETNRATWPSSNNSGLSHPINGASVYAVWLLWYADFACWLFFCHDGESRNEKRKPKRWHRSIIANKKTEHQAHHSKYKNENQQSIHRFIIVFCVAYRITKLLRRRCFHAATVGFYSILAPRLFGLKAEAAAQKRLHPKPSPPFSNLIRLRRWLEHVQPSLVWWWLMVTFV